MTTADVPYKFLSTAESPPRGSVTQTVTDQLRRAIVSLEIEPGAVLDKGAICERLSVSRFPVSEALARLAAEGLVEILPQRGSRVTKVRLADVVDGPVADAHALLELRQPGHCFRQGPGFSLGEHHGDVDPELLPHLLLRGVDGQLL